MHEMTVGDVKIFDQTFKVFGYAEDAGYRSWLKNGWSAFNVEHLKSFVAPDAICLDLGANVGLMTLAMSMVARHGHVYAIEASPETAAALKQTIRVNHVENVTTLQGIVGRLGEPVKFFDVPGMRSSGYFLPNDDKGKNYGNRPDPSEMLMSETVSVDALVEKLQIPRLDFIKIDVEGAELDVLDGAQKSLARFRPIVVMEFNSYVFTHLRGIIPRRALRQILDTFEEVYNFYKRVGDLRRLDDGCREQFLHDNLTGGFVDDLLCGWKDSRWIVPSRVDLKQSAAT